MKCPVDQEVLSIADRSGIEIDFCPTCRGVWLDRGELDKLIERSETSAQQPAPTQHTNSYPPHQQEGAYPRQDYSHKKKRKSSIIGEIFDF